MAQNSTTSTKSLPTASYVKNIEDDAWTKAFTWYDAKGRPIGSHSINHFEGFTKTESVAGFCGEIQESNTRHKRLDSDTETLVHEELVSGLLFRQFVNIVFSSELCTYQLKQNQALLRSNLPGIGWPTKYSFRSTAFCGAFSE